MKLLISSPAPVSRMTASAISAMAKALRAPCRMFPEPLRPPSFSTSCRLVADACIAGSAPNSNPVNTETPMVNHSTAASMPMRSFIGNCIGVSFSRASRPTYASPKPSAPPTNARITLSVSICRTVRQRLAPSAVRIAISFCRAAARASSRFAIFAHAISNTNPTANSSTTNGRRTSPSIASFRGIVSTYQPPSFCP